MLSERPYRMREVPRGLQKRVGADEAGQQEAEG